MRVIRLTLHLETGSVTHTLVRMKGKVRSLVPILLIKLFQVPSPFRLNHVKYSCYYFYTFIFVLLVCSTIIFLLQVLHIVKISLCTTIGIRALLVTTQLFKETSISSSMAHIAASKDRRWLRIPRSKRRQPHSILQAFVPTDESKIFR